MSEPLHPSKRGPWSVCTSTSPDRDGDPLYLVVGPSDGSHVTEQDAEWLRLVIRRATRRDQD